MSTVIVEVDVYDASIVVPEDGDDAGASSVLTAFQSLANRTKHLLVMFATLAASKLGNKAIGNLDWTPQWLTSGGVPAWLVNNSGVTAINSAAGKGFKSIDNLLVDGCTITNCGAFVHPGAARGTVGNRMTLYLKKRQSNTSGTWTTIASGTDDGTTAIQNIPVVATEVVDKTSYSYSLWLAGGADADTNIDTFLGASITLA